MTRLTPRTTGALFLALVLAAACGKAPEPPATPAGSAPAPAAASGADQVAWQRGDIEAAFARARSENKPLFLYWGAAWCPYCNQVKATLFNRADFAERARHFIAVELDGDAADGQKLATRFKVAGYPTMILFRPDGTELTRLPGEIEPERVLQVLALGMAARRPVREVLDAALHGRPVSTDEWRLLAYYAFDTDEDTLVPKAALPGTLARLAAAVPPAQPEVATRLTLKALHAHAAVAGGQQGGNPAAAAVLQQVLADPAETRLHADQLVIDPPRLLALLAPDAAAQAPLAAAWEAALARLAEDRSLSTTDRLQATAARVALVRRDGGAVPEALAKALQQQVVEADKATQNPHERQSVITTAAAMLADADRLDAADYLLQAELKRSATPWTYMRMLGTHARQRGNLVEALKWYEQAWKSAEGSATRLQWGAGYVNGLIDMTPGDLPRIEAAARGLFEAAAGTPDAFHGRNRSVLQRTAGKLGEWAAADTSRRATVARVRAAAAQACTPLPTDDAQRPVCEQLARLTPPPRPAS